MLRRQNRDTSEGLATRRQRSGHSWRPRLRFAVPSTDEAVCFIASFVRSEERAVKLKHMLLSIAAQEPASPSVAISWAATDELVPTVRKTLDAVTAAGLRLRSIEQSVPHTQFEHLRALAQLHASRPPEWVLFSDDDDLWSERRFALYMAEIASAVPSTTCILCRRKAMLQGETTDTNPQDAHTVRKMMADGVVRLTDCNEPDGLDESQHNMAEYFDAAVRYDTLASFVFNMPSKVIGHKLCDLAFGFVTTNCRTCVRFMPRAADEFVYFYNRGNQPGGASTSVTPTNQEAEIARHAVLSAPPPVQALFFGDGSRASPVLHGHARLPSASEGQQCAINFVAGLRMAIEQE